MQALNPQELRHTKEVYHYNQLKSLRCKSHFLLMSFWGYDSLVCTFWVLMRILPLLSLPEGDQNQAWLYDLCCPSEKMIKQPYSANVRPNPITALANELWGKKSHLSHLWMRLDAWDIVNRICVTCDTNLLVRNTPESCPKVTLPGMDRDEIWT